MLAKAARHRAIRSPRPESGRVGVTRNRRLSAKPRWTLRWTIGEKLTVIAVNSWKAAMASAIALATAPTARSKAARGAGAPSLRTRRSFKSTRRSASFDQSLFPQVPRSAGVELEARKFRRVLRGG